MKIINKTPILSSVTYGTVCFGVKVEDFYLFNQSDYSDCFSGNDWQCDVFQNRLIETLHVFRMRSSQSSIYSYELFKHFKSLRPKDWVDSKASL